MALSPSSGIVSVCSLAGETVLRAAQIKDNDDVQTLTGEVKAATSRRHVTLVSQSGQRLLEDRSARENGVADGDQLTAIFGKHDVLYLIPTDSDYLLRYDITADQVGGIELAGVDELELSFGDSAAFGNNLYVVPGDSDAILIHNTVTEETTSVDVSTITTCDKKFIAAIVANGRLHCVPGNANQLLVYDLSSAEIWGVDLSHVAAGSDNWHSAVLVGDDIIAMPCSAAAILIYNTVSGEVSSVDVSPTARLCIAPGDPIVQDGSKLYVIPNEYNKILVFDIDSLAVSEMDVSNVIPDQQLWCGGTLVDGRFYAVPLDGDFILVHDIAAGRASLINISILGQHGWSKIVTIDGVIYGAPYTCGIILKYDTSTGQASGIDVSVYTQGCLNVFTDVIAIKGKLYFVPFNMRSILVYDIVQDIITAVDVAEFAGEADAVNWQFGVHVVEQ